MFSLFLLTVFTIANGNFEKEFKDQVPNSEIFRRYNEMNLELKALASKGVKMILPYVMEASERMNLSRTCTKNLIEFINGFRRLTTWSIQSK